VKIEKEYIDCMGNQMYMITINDHAIKAGLSFQEAEKIADQTCNVCNGTGLFDNNQMKIKLNNRIK